MATNMRLLDLPSAMMMGMMEILRNESVCTSEVMRVLGFKLFTTYFVIGRLVLCLSLDESFDNALKHTSIVSK